MNWRGSPPCRRTAFGLNGGGNSGGGGGGSDGGGAGLIFGLVRLLLWLVLAQTLEASPPECRS
jgi:hypothetical protein